MVKESAIWKEGGRYGMMPAARSHASIAAARMPAREIGRHCGRLFGKRRRVARPRDEKHALRERTAHMHSLETTEPPSVNRPRCIAQTIHSR